MEPLKLNKISKTPTVSTGTGKNNKESGPEMTTTRRQVTQDPSNKEILQAAGSQSLQFVLHVTPDV